MSPCVNKSVYVLVVMSLPCAYSVLPKAADESTGACLADTLRARFNCREEPAVLTVAYAGMGGAEHVALELARSLGAWLSKRDTPR